MQLVQILLPLYDTSRKPVGLPVAPPFGIGLTAILDIGLWFYDRLAGRRSIAPHRRLSAVRPMMPRRSAI